MENASLGPPNEWAGRRESFFQKGGNFSDEVTRMVLSEARDKH